MMGPGWVVGVFVCVCVRVCGRDCVLYCPPPPHLRGFRDLSRSIGRGEAMEGGRRWTRDIGVWHREGEGAKVL